MEDNNTRDDSETVNSQDSGQQSSLAQAASQHTDNNEDGELAQRSSGSRRTSWSFNVSLSNLVDLGSLLLGVNIWDTVGRVLPLSKPPPDITDSKDIFCDLSQASQNDIQKAVDRYFVFPFKLPWSQEHPSVPGVRFVADRKWIETARANEILVPLGSDASTFGKRFIAEVVTAVNTAGLLSDGSWKMGAPPIVSLKPSQSVFGHFFNDDYTKLLGTTMITSGATLAVVPDDGTPWILGGTSARNSGGEQNEWLIRGVKENHECETEWCEGIEAADKAACETLITALFNDASRPRRRFFW